MRQMFIAMETHSEEVLHRCGAYRYAESEDFQTLLIGYSVDGGSVQVVDVIHGENLPQDIVEALKDERIVKYAYDAQFERICLSRYLGYPSGTYLPPEQWRSLKVWAALSGLPTEKSMIASWLGIRNDYEEAETFVREVCTSTLWGKGAVEAAQMSMQSVVWRLFRHCLVKRLMMEKDILHGLRRCPMPDREWQYDHMIQRMDDYGVQIDVRLVQSAMDCDALYRQEYEAVFRETTGIKGPLTASQFRRWLAMNSVPAQSVSQREIWRLKKTAQGDIALAMEMWQLLSRPVAQKFSSIKNAVSRDGRLRGLFHDADRTGHFGNAIVQLDNLPVCRMNELGEIRERVRSGQHTDLDIRCASVPQSLMELLTTVFTAPIGKRLTVAVYTALEEKALAWLADKEQPAWDDNSGVYALESYDAKIQRLTADLDSAIRACLTGHSPKETHGLLLNYTDGILHLLLPSGHSLYYHQPAVLEDQLGGSMIWCRQTREKSRWVYATYSGERFVRDIGRGVARDLLMEAMLEITRCGYAMVMQQNNSVVIESEWDKTAIEICEIMRRTPSWAKGLELHVRSFSNDWLEKTANEIG